MPPKQPRPTTPQPKDGCDTSTCETPQNEVDPAAMLEIAKAKEVRTAKKEKELKKLAEDLDRRQKVIEDTEEKLGTIAQRETVTESKEKDIQAQNRTLKKRDAVLKEKEDAFQVRVEAIDAQEAQLDKRRDDIAQRQEKLDKREKELKESDDLIHQRRLDVRERENVAKQLESELEEKKKELVQLQAQVSEAQAAANAGVAVAKKHEKEAKAREEAAEKLTKQANEKAAQAEKKEADTQKEKSRIQELAEKVDREERKTQSEQKMLALTREDINRRLTVVEGQEGQLRKRKEEFEEQVGALTAQKEALQQSIAANHRYEHELRLQQNEIAKQQDDLVMRERKLATGLKEVQSREMLAKMKERTLVKQQDEIQQQQRQVELRQAAVSEREQNVTVREEKVTQLVKKCAEMEQATSKRQSLLDKKEKDLVDWMKEMEWREMMLGQREDVVRRQPVVLNTFDDEAGATPEDRKNSPSRKRADDKDQSGNPLGFSHRAFGHAVVSVQFQRLKDQYISAQMKHARAELSADAQRQLLNQKRKRHPRAGIVVTHGSSDIAADAAARAEADELESEVHKMSVQFVRMMSHLRAFDGFEDPTSPEKLAHLNWFTANQRTILCMTANTEYILRSFEEFITTMRRSPLDEKEKATDVQDLVNRTTHWWRRTTVNIQQARIVLLRDRQRFLKQALHVLNSNEGASAQVVATPPDTEGMKIAESAQATEAYAAASHYLHVKESKILAPRGLATLRAVSAAHGSQPATADEESKLAVTPTSQTHAHQTPSPIPAPRPLLMTTSPTETWGGALLSFENQGSKSVDLCLVRSGKLVGAKEQTHLKKFDLSTTPTPVPIHSSPYNVPPLKQAYSPNLRKKRPATGPNLRTSSSPNRESPGAKSKPDSFAEV